MELLLVFLYFLIQFESKRKLGGEKLWQSFKNELEKPMDDEFPNFKKQNEEKRKSNSVGAIEITLL